MASEELVRGVVSASLLNPSWDDLTKFVENPDFDLGMGEWLSDPLPADFEGMSAWMSSLPDLSCITDMDDGIDENSSSAPKRSRLSLPKKGVPVFKEVGNRKPSTSRRFAQPVESPEREKAAKGVIPAKTAASTQWALKNFNDWAHNRSFVDSAEAVPSNLFSSHDAELVCKWLSSFVLETRKSDGSPYPPATLRSLVSGLNRVLQSNKAPFSVLDKSDHRFRDFLKTLDSLSSELHRQGVGVSKNSAKVIDPSHEDIFWASSLLGYSSPKVLQRTVFFYVGLNFVLRGVQEQYDLLPSQFSRVPQDRSVYNESVYYEYTELIAKNNQHRFKDINMKNKCTRAYALPGNERCVVKLLDAYLTLLPPNAPYFYMRVLDDADPTKRCVTKQRVGINSLKNILPELSEKSGVGVHYTNHSLRATAITRMFNSGIPEKVIAETSGHKSTKALRCYEHTSQQLKQDVTKVINRSCKVPTSECTATVPMSEPECKPVISHLKEEKPECKPAAQSIPQSFSGSFTNCTINISL